MKRWLIFSLMLVALVCVVFFLLRPYLFPSSTPRSGVLLTPHSAYKYSLCMEAYAVFHSSPGNPFQTDYSFRDPFRKVTDTVVPHILNYNSDVATASFLIDVAINQVATFHLLLLNVHVADGISVLVPDEQNLLHRSNVPQFIVASFGYGRMAVLDYTCSDQWTWARLSTNHADPGERVEFPKS